MFMKFMKIICLCLLIFVDKSSGQTPQGLPWNLALSAAGISSEDRTVTCTDNSGNIYVTGHTSSSSLNFGNSVTIAGSGIFLAKWNSSGIPVWAIRIAGANNNSFKKIIRCDSNGNVYINADSTFGSNGYWQGIMKFNTNGSRLWTKGGIRNSNSIPMIINDIGAICDFILDNAGNVILSFEQGNGSGNFSGTSIVFTPVNECLLLMKLDNSGNVLWYKQSTNQNICSNYGTKLAVNSTNDIFFFTFRGAPCGISGFGFDTSILPLNGANLMAFKFSSAGTVLAASLIGNSNNFGSVYDLNVMCTPSGNIYVEFSGDAQLQNGTFNLYDSVAGQNGSPSVVLLKINSSLSPLWVKAHQQSFSVTPNSSFQKMYLDNQENVYTAEEYFNQVSVDGNVFPISAGAQANTSDILVLKYTSSGGLVGAGTVFSSSMDKITGMAVDVNGNAILTGNFSGSQLRAGSYTLNNAGGSDFFLTRISGCLGTPAATITAGGPTSFCAGNSVTLSATNVPGATFQWKKNNVNIATNSTSRSYSSNATGSYTCVVTNACGTTTTNAISVSTITNAAVTFSTSGSTSFCSGDSIIVNATNLGSNYSIQWYRNNSSIQNAIGYSLTVKQPGTYKTVTKNLSTGCSRISATSVTTTVNCRMSNPNLISVLPMELESPFTIGDELHSAKIASPNDSKPIHLFPNPNTGSFTLEMDGLDGVVEIQVVDVFGKIVYMDSMMANDNNFHTNIQLGDAMQAGIYLVRVQNNGLQHESKVILQ
jgi:hypothetical protein